MILNFTLSDKKQTTGELISHAMFNLKYRYILHNTIKKG